MNQNEIQDKFESIHSPINRYLWIFCGLLLSFYGYVSAPQSSLRVLLKELLLCPLCPPKEKSPCENSFCLFPSEKKKSLMLGFPPLFIRQPTPYGISYFHFFLRARGYGKSIMCGSLGDFPKDAAVSCLVSDQIPFNLLSICSWTYLSRDLPTFYMQPGFFLQANHMQPGFLPSFPIRLWSPLLDGSKSHAKLKIKLK